MTFQNILLIELLGGIGDLMIALPAIRAVKRSHPAAMLTVLTFAPGSTLLQPDPDVHCVIEVQPGKARQTVETVLASTAFDLIISDTNYDGIADVIDRSGAKQVITNLWRSPPPNQLVSDRFLQLLVADGVIDAAEMLSSAPLIHLGVTERAIAQQAFGAAYRPLVFLIPDAGMAIKRWSDQRFGQLGQALQQQHHATIAVAVGSDLQQAQSIVAAIGGSAILWQRSSLRQLAAALAQADLAIAADTGAARMAAALNVPTITLFGPSWSGRYGHPAPHVNLQGCPTCPERNIANFTEQTCWYSGNCPFDWQTCLDEIAVETVLDAAKALLQPHPEKIEPREQERSPVPDSLPNRAASVTQSSLLSPWQKVRNLLVLRLDNIGDVLMTSPTLQAIQQNLPDATLTLMASPAGALTAPLLPGVDEVLSGRTLWQDLGRLEFDPTREWQLIETLRDRQFDAAIILTSFSQSPHPPALICALAGIPLRLGESKEADLGTLTHPVSPAPDDMHQVDRNLRLIEAVGFQVRDRRLTLNIPPLTLPIPQPYLLLTPWTSCQSRNYSPDRFAQAARRLSEMLECKIVVTGVAKDRDRAHFVLDALGKEAIDWVGQTSLSELVALVANAKLVLTNNTSTMHIADATQTPTVVLFAGTELECQWQPRFSRSRLLRRPTVCSPCYAFQCPYDLQCLEIAPETVVAAGLEVLRSPSAHLAHL